MPLGRLGWVGSAYRPKACNHKCRVTNLGEVIATWRTEKSRLSLYRLVCTDSSDCQGNTMTATKQRIFIFFSENQFDKKPSSCELHNMPHREYIVLLALVRTNLS